MNTTCSCDTLEQARRISGFWTLTKIVVLNQLIKLHFMQGGETLVHVIFDPTRVDEFEEGKIYSLVGWQKYENRFNALYFD